MCHRKQRRIQILTLQRPICKVELHNMHACSSGIIGSSIWRRGVRPSPPVSTLVSFLYLPLKIPWFWKQQSLRDRKAWKENSASSSNGDTGAEAAASRMWTPSCCSRRLCPSSSSYFSIGELIGCSLVCIWANNPSATTASIYAHLQIKRWPRGHALSTIQIYIIEDDLTPILA